MNEESKVITNLSVRHLITAILVSTLLGAVIQRIRLPFAINSGLIELVLTIALSAFLICTMKVPVNKPPQIRGMRFDFSSFSVVYLLVWLREGLLWLAEVVGFDDRFNIIGHSTVSIVSEQVKSSWFILLHDKQFFISIAVILGFFVWDAIYAKMIIDRTYGLGSGVAILVCTLLLGMHASSWSELIVNLLIHIYLAEAYVRTGRISNYILLPILANVLAVFSNIYLDIEFIGGFVGLEWLVVNYIFGFVEKALLVWGAIGLLGFFLGGLNLNIRQNKKIFVNVGMLFWIVYCVGFLISYSMRLFY